MRLAGVEKAGFYATQPHTLSILTALAHPVGPGPHLVIDPCCGEGEAARTLADAWQCLAYGNELEIERYQAAAKILDKTTSGDLVRLEVSPGAAGAIYYNPPFAYDGAVKGRLEVLYLPYLFAWLAPGGLLVMNLPEAVIERDDMRLALIRDYTNLQVRRYPADEYDQFKQVIVFGQRREAPQTNVEQKAERMKVKYLGPNMQDDCKVAQRRVFLGQPKIGEEYP